MSVGRQRNRSRVHSARLSALVPMLGLGAVLSAASLPAPLQANCADVAEAQGSLVIVGGGPRPDSIVRSIVELAGGGEGVLVIVPSASSEPKKTARYERRQFEEAGGGRVRVLHPLSRDEGAEVLQSATGLFFSGGDQRRLWHAMRESGLLEEVCALYRRGGVIAGTSAGAAVMSERMITGDELVPDGEDPFDAVEAENVETWEGFGLLPGTIVDQHFVRRSRHNRLLSLVLENPALLGIGIDESTAVVVGPPDRFRVVGKSTVVVYDAHRAAGVERDARGHLAATDVLLHLLTDGDGFDLVARRPLP